MKKILSAPTTGKIVELVSLEDEVFSSKLMGEGVVIKSTDGLIVSPIEGEITIIGDSKHAYGIKTDDGLELLIHIGIDTVNLNGKGFHNYVNVGQRVIKGDKLSKFDVKELLNNGFEPLVILIITNTKDYDKISIESKDSINTGELLLTVFDKNDKKNTIAKESKILKNNKLADDILKYIGGENNINQLTHCATRLRFNLKDMSKVNKSKIENLDILRVIEASGQFQIVIGPEVSSLYQEINNKINLNTDNINSDNEMSKVKLSDKIFDIISGSFSPLIPLICGSGLIKALITVLTLVGFLNETSGTYAILSAAGNAAFYFLPVLLGFTVALKMKASPYIGAAIGAALLEPNFTNLAANSQSSTFMGIPVVLPDYSSTVLPVFVSVIVFSLFEKQLKKIIPSQLHMIFIPFLSLIVMVPITVLVFGPFGIYVAEGIANILEFLLQTSSLLTGAILAASWVPIVVFGLHWAIIPICISNISALGQDPILGMVMCTVWVSGGAALGVLMKTKNTKLKNVAVASLIPCFLSGVSEPIIYGILFQYKKVFGIVIGMCALMGALSGALQIKATQLAGGIFTIPTYITVLNYLIVVIISVFGTAIIVYFLGYESIKKNN